MSTRLLLVDDHAVVRSGLRMLLENERDMEIIGEASSARQAIELATQLKPNVILMDIGLPDLSGIDATREIKKLLPEAAIVALTIHEDEEYFLKCLKWGPQATYQSVPHLKNCSLLSAPRRPDRSTCILRLRNC